MPAASPASTRSGRSPSTTIAMPARPKRRPRSRSTISASRFRCRGAFRCWRTSASASSANAPSRFPTASGRPSSSTTWSWRAPSAGRSTSPTAARCSRTCFSRSGAATATMTVTTRSPRRPACGPWKSACCAPMAAICSRPASRRARTSSPARSTAIRRSRGVCTSCSSRFSIRRSLTGRSRRATSRRRSRTNSMPSPALTTTPSSAAT